MGFTIYVQYIGKDSKWSRLMGSFESIREAMHWLYETYTEKADFWNNIERISIE